VTISTELEDIFNCNIKFISDERYKTGIDIVRSHGFTVETIGDVNEDIEIMQEIDPDIILVDVSEMDASYQESLRQMSAAIVDFENIYDGDEPVDFVVNPQRDPERISQENYLNGPEYLVIRDEFREVTSEITERAENVLFTFGGTDPLGLTIDCVSAFAEADLDLNYRVIVGPGFNEEARLQSIPEVVRRKFDFYRDVESMSDFMQWADIAVSAGGRTVYELAATGTPTVVIAQNNGEVERMKFLREKGAIEFLGHGQKVDFGAFPAYLNDLAKDKERRAILSKRAEEIVDGQGLQRIVAMIEQMFVGSE
jgi:spore coat polysaccharide biosynthesis predicted glycosyltransferase SpsG